VIMPNDACGEWRSTFICKQFGLVAASAWWKTGSRPVRMCVRSLPQQAQFRQSKVLVPTNALLLSDALAVIRDECLSGIGYVSASSAQAGFASA
jgi:hypothetical protein